MSQFQQSQQFDLKTMNVNDLKALVYDHLALIENSQKAIQIINQEISLRNQQASQNGSGRPELVKSDD